MQYEGDLVKKELVGLASSIDDDLEGIVSLTCKELGFNYEIFDLQGMSDFIINDYIAIIVSKEEDLKNEKIKNCFLTPVIYLASPDEIEEIMSKEEFKKDYNLHEICSSSIDDAHKFSEVLEKTIINKQGLLYSLGHKIDKLSNIDSKEIPSPKFDSIFKEFYHDKAFINYLWVNLMPLITQRHELIKTKIIINKDSSAKNIRKKKFSEWWKVEVAEQTSRFSYLPFLYDEYKKFNKNLIKVLGDDEIGEGGVGTRSPELGFLRGVFRFERSKGDYDAQIIAIQRFIDAQRFQDTLFNVPQIYFPVPFGDGEKQKSFWASEYIPGIPLHKIFGILNKAIKEDKLEDLSTIQILRSKFLEKTVDDLVYWTNNAGETFVSKPPHKSLKCYYKKSLENLLDRLTISTGIEFSNSEKNEFKKGIEIMKSLKVEDEYIVRNRDAVFNNNVIVSSAMRDDEIDLDILLSEFIFKSEKKDGDTNKKIIKKELLSKTKIGEKIDERFYNVDLSYRYCHVLENIAQIATMYEAAYLWEQKGQSYASLNNPNKLVQKFLKNVGCKELYDDKYSIHLMYFFRSARKLLLFCNYWENYLVKTNNEIEPEKRKRFAENMLHYTKLSEFNINKMIETNTKKENTEEKERNAEYLVSLKSAFSKIRENFENYDNIEEILKYKND